jgi:fatty-acyl-CoA synthase
VKQPHPDDLTVHAHFRRMAKECGGRVIVRIARRDGDSAELTWGALLDGAARSAERLRAAGVARGTTTAIMRHLSPELLFDFLGAIAIGALPCVVGPPNPRMAAEVFARKLSGMAGAAGFEFVLIDAGRPELMEAARSISDVKVLEGEIGDRSVPLPTLSDAAELFSDNPDPDDPVFLQHSSGTSGVPKGVVVTHRALLTQLRHYGASIAVAENDRIASWLPLYHDMGMVACLWGGLLWNVPATHLSNFEWVMDPWMLFDAVERDWATLVWLPNFGFSLLAGTPPGRRGDGVERAEQPAIQTVRKWVNCSEPVRGESFDAFIARFGGAGASSARVTPHSLAASYAMAENIFAVTQTADGTPMRLEVDRQVLERDGRAVAAARGTPSRALVSSGRAIAGTEIAIVSRDGARTNAIGVTGEILIRGDCLFSRYHNRPELTAAAFRDGWYATGDIGFLWGAGGAGESIKPAATTPELFVIGRNRDLIICGGRNIDPAEIEALAASVTGVAAGRACCVGLDNAALGTEDVHLIVEAEERAANDPRAIAATLKQLAVQMNLPLRQVCVMPRGWLVKSSSGKIARRECRAKLIADSLSGTG